MDVFALLENLFDEEQRSILSDALQLPSALLTADEDAVDAPSPASRGERLETSVIWRDFCNRRSYRMVK